MTPDERADAIADRFMGVCLVYGETERLHAAIAAAIREAVTEAEATAKQAIEQRDEANRQRNCAAHKAAQNWQMYLNVSRAATTYREERDNLGFARFQVLTALEPFALLADYYRDLADRRFNLEGDAPTISSSQLRAARDAYLALGGETEARSE